MHGNVSQFFYFNDDENSMLVVSKIDKTTTPCKSKAQPEKLARTHHLLQLIERV